MKQLVLKLFLRMFKAGEFNLLLFSLVIATASITSISFFIERIEHTLFSEASTFIAADAKIEGSLAIPTTWQQQAHDLQLETAKFSSFKAMVFSDNGMKLGRVKAVDNHYPLRGKLETLNPNQSRTIEQHGPGRGETWLAPSLMSTLDIAIGDSVKIGHAAFTVSAVIISEPDSTATRFGLSPRALINLQDMPSTGAVQLGSRIGHAFLIAGDSAAISLFKNSIENDLGEHFRWLGPKDGNRALGGAVDRAQRFLLLAGSLSVILSGLAIAMAAQRFSNKQRNQVALLKCFGLKPIEIQSIYLGLLAALAVIGMTTGSAIGWLLHKIIIILLGNLIPPDLAAASIYPLVIGALTCCVCLFAFAGPPVIALKHISPMQILKQQASRFLALRANIILGLCSFTGLILFYSQSLLITSILIAGIIACILSSSLFSYFILRVTKKIQTRFKGEWRLGLANLQRNRIFTGLQIFVFSSIALLVLVLFQVRTNLIETWKPQIATTPNHFIYNIFSDELAPIKSELAAAGISENTFYPMSRGRLVKINDVDASSKIPSDSRVNYKRELNLTWSSTFGEDNKIVAGKWWAEGQEKSTLASVEQRYAQGLGLELGDTLTFSIAGKEFRARLSNIRSVKWDSMNPNFYIIFNRPIADDFAANWVSSFYLAPDQKPFIYALSKHFPTISVVEFDQTLAQIKSVATRVSMAVEFILMLVLGASLLVVLTSIKSSIEERLRETALLRSFGASRQFTQRVILIEFSTVGFIAGLFACTGAELSLYFIQIKVFDMPYAPSVFLWLTAPITSTIIIACIGYLATVSTTHVPPLQALKARL